MIAVKDGFVRVAAATPRVSVANVEENARRVGEMVRQAAEAGCGAVCFPELALTGYTCGDLFRDRALLSGAERALASLLEETAGLDILCAVGVPVPWNGALYNCAAVFHKGRLLGLPAKGRLEPGCDGDFVLLDGELNVAATVVGGSVVFEAAAR